jgi:hypothetical protein
MYRVEQGRVVCLSLPKINLMDAKTIPSTFISILVDLLHICVVTHSVFIYFSGGVMIYFDRIEVVNYLVPSAGKVICQ